MLKPWVVLKNEWATHQKNTLNECAWLTSGLSRTRHHTANAMAYYTCPMHEPVTLASMVAMPAAPSSAAPRWPTLIIEINTCD
jgi:hypothetical protein